jgi:hypothetical protein
VPDGSPLTAPPITTVPEAIVRLQEIQEVVEASAPRRLQDGVACFNWMYRVVTVRAFEAFEQGLFDDREFFILLDVAFVNLYLDALRADATGAGAVPRSWQALLESRSAPRVCTIQFAVAGMNAHINYDLSRAVVGACAQLGREPRSGTQRADFEAVNRILAAEMANVRDHFQDRLEDWVDDHVLGQVDDAIGVWSIDAARDTAWVNAELLWCLRGDSFGTGLFLTSLDRLVGLAGRGLLVRL